MRARAAWPLLLLAAVSGLAEATLAQGPGGSISGGVDSIRLRDHPFGALAVSAHPWSSVVALSITIPVGSAVDERELAGSAWLLGEAVRAALDAPLARLGTSASVSVGRGATRFQVLAAPSAWRDAYDVLLDGVFTAPLAFADLEHTRSDLQALLRFERGAPVREFQDELAALLGEPGSSWAHDPRGTEPSLGRVTATDLNALKRRVYRREGAVVSIVGALDAPPGVVVYTGASGERTSQSPPGEGAAWVRGERKHLVRPVTSGWIGVAFPAPPRAPRTALEFIAERLAADLNPSPKDPGLFGTEVRIEDLPGGAAIVLEAAVLPEDQARWEARMVRALDELQARYREPLYFSLHQRHFRNATLVRESAPEVEGARILADVLRGGSARDLPGEIDALTAEAVVRTITSLGEPRVLLFGPQMGR